MNHEPGPVIAIAGRTRAGKTTLSSALGDELGWPVTSFSAYVRAEAKRRGIAEERRALQDLGADLIDELGWREFSASALRHAGLTQASAPFVVEGVRHAGTLGGLRAVLRPVPVRLLYLRVSDEERNRRLALEGVTAAEGAAWEEHSTEREVLAVLPGLADLTVDADQPFEAELREVLDWLRAG